MKEMTDKRRQSLRFIASTIESLYQQRPATRYELGDDTCSLSAAKFGSGKWRIRPLLWSEEKCQWFDFSYICMWLATSFEEGMARFRKELEVYDE